MVKVLFFAADPLSAEGGSARLLLDEDVRQTLQKVRAAEYRDEVEFDVRWAVRTDDLLQALNETRPQVVHFSGHGGSAGLVLVGVDGTAHPVGAAALGQLFDVFRGDIRVVVLSACFSLPQAQAIADAVGCAIGTRGAISDTASITFGASFYRALAFGHSVQAAFDQARTALVLEHFDDRECPELIVRPGVDPASITGPRRRRRRRREAGPARTRAVGGRGPGHRRARRDGQGIHRAPGASFATEFPRARRPPLAARAGGGAPAPQGLALSRRGVDCVAGRRAGPGGEPRAGAGPEHDPVPDCGPAPLPRALVRVAVPRAACAAAAIALSAGSVLAGAGLLHRRSDADGAASIRSLAGGLPAAGAGVPGAEPVQPGSWEIAPFPRSLKPGGVVPSKPLKPGLGESRAAGWERDLALARDLYNEKNYAGAHPICERAAAAGSAEAMGFLGIMYLNGQGAARRYDLAIPLLRRAADAGDPRAMNALGVAYTNGQGVERDYAEAMRWYRAAQQMGYAEAMKNVGMMFELGLGRARDTSMGRRWYHRAAEAGSAGAMVDLGRMHQKGIGGARDYAQARAWYMRAAEAGHADGMNNMGVLYTNGWGVPRDRSEAIRWFRRAAEAGSTDAGGNLAALGAAWRIHDAGRAVLTAARPRVRLPSSGRSGGCAASAPSPRRPNHLPQRTFAASPPPPPAVDCR